jgi:3-methyladenine DNA glycosylase/8-oxoguanine DNA glycosylase
MDKQMRLTQMRDRMRSKLDMKKQMKEIQDKLQETPLPSITNAAPPISDDELEALFNSVGKTLKKDDK